MAWNSAGLLVNPAIDTILADTGPISLGNHQVILASSVQTIGVVEWRNAANSANIQSQVIGVPAFGVCDLNFQAPLQPGERIRVRLFAAITGSCQVSIIG